MAGVARRPAPVPVDEAVDAEPVPTWDGEANEEPWESSFSSFDCIDGHVFFEMVDSALSLSRTDFAYLAVGGEGAAIYGEGLDLELDDMSFYDNEAGASGGSVAVHEGSVT